MYGSGAMLADRQTTIHAHRNIPRQEIVGLLLLFFIPQVVKIPGVKNYKS